MSLHVYDDLEQGSEDWLAARRGIVTASVVGQLITVGPPAPTTVTCHECGAAAGSPCVSRARKVPVPIKTVHASRIPPADAPQVIEPARTDASRSLTTLLAAERITGWSDPVFVNNDMMRGTLDEPLARNAYARHCTSEIVSEVGFMIRDDWGFPIGYSPDGLVGDDGLIEIKSRKQKKHLATILADAVPAENMAQIQCGLLVSGRQWCDYVSYCGGMPLWTKRVHPDDAWFDAIVDAVAFFEKNAAEMVATFYTRTAGRPETERIDHFQDLVI